MKRSQINALIEKSIAFVAQQHFHLPPWARWSAERWLSMGEEADEILKHGLGWIVTDFGGEDFLPCQ